MDTSHAVEKIIREAATKAYRLGQADNEFSRDELVTLRYMTLRSLENNHIDAWQIGTRELMLAKIERLIDAKNGDGING